MRYREQERSVKSLPDKFFTVPHLLGNRYMLPLEEGKNNLLEIASVSKAPKIYNDQGAEAQLKQKFPGASFEIIPGYSWKSEFKSFSSTARRFKIDGKEMFLLPNGDINEEIY